MKKPVALGVDIGGTHITAALVDLESKSLLKNSIKRCLVDSGGGKESILSAWTEVINDAFKGVPNESRFVGVAFPGPSNYDEGISLIEDQDKFKTLYKVNIKDELASRLKISTANIFFVNDAAAFLQGEIFAGATNANANVFGLTLGTGLGSAFSFNNIASDAALWNSKFFDGIAEDYLSGRWFVERYRRLSGAQLDGVKELVEIAGIDVLATQVFKEFGGNLAQFLIPIIKKHDINTVIIGGNIADAFFLFSPELITKLKVNDVNVSIKISELKEHAALIGAASCCEGISYNDNLQD